MATESNEPTRTFKRETPTRRYVTDPARLVGYIGDGAARKLRETGFGVPNEGGELDIRKVEALESIAADLRAGRRASPFLRVRGTTLTLKLHRWPESVGMPELVVKVNRWSVLVSTYTLRSGKLYRLQGEDRELLCDCALGLRMFRRDDAPLAVRDINRVVDRALTRVIRDNTNRSERLRTRLIAMLKPLGVAMVTGTKGSIGGL